MKPGEKIFWPLDAFSKPFSYAPRRNSALLTLALAAIFATAAWKLAILSNSGFSLRQAAEKLAPSAAQGTAWIALKALSSFLCLLFATALTWWIHEKTSALSSYRAGKNTKAAFAAIAKEFVSPSPRQANGLLARIAAYLSASIAIFSFAFLPLYDGNPLAGGNISAAIAVLLLPIAGLARKTAQAAYGERGLTAASEISIRELPVETIRLLSAASVFMLAGGADWKSLSEFGGPNPPYNWIAAFPLAGQAALACFFAASVPKPDYTPFRQNAEPADMLRGPLRVLSLFSKHAETLFSACLVTTIFLGGTAPLHGSLAGMPGLFSFAVKTAAVLFSMSLAQVSFCSMGGNSLQKIIFPLAALNFAGLGLWLCLR